MSRPATWLVIIDPAGVARVVERSETTAHARYTLRSRERSVAVARRLNDGPPLEFAEEEQA